MTDVINNVAKKLNLKPEEVMELKESLDALIEEKASQLANAKAAVVADKMNQEFIEASKKWKEQLHEIKTRYRDLAKAKYEKKYNQLMQQVAPILEEAVETIKAKRHMVKALKALGAGAIVPDSVDEIMAENKKLKDKIAILESKMAIAAKATDLDSHAEQVRFVKAAKTMLNASGPSAITESTLDSLIRVVKADSEENVETRKCRKKFSSLLEKSRKGRVIKNASGHFTKTSRKLNLDIE